MTQIVRAEPIPNDVKFHIILGQNWMKTQAKYVFFPKNTTQFPHHFVMLHKNTWFFPHKLNFKWTWWWWNCANRTYGKRREHLPEDMPGRMPEDMPDRMPENMSDRMPEDLPVTKCINVMVGITRSKVIFKIIFGILSLFSVESNEWFWEVCLFKTYCSMDFLRLNPCCK